MKYSPWTRALVLTVVAACASLGTAFAQTPPSEPPPGTPPPGGGKAEERIDHRLQVLTEKLNLTPAQQGQVKTILENEASSAKAIHNNASLSEDQKKAEWKSLRETTHSQLNAVLTPDQQKTLAEMHEEHHRPPPQS